jgi:hypothetical protein
LEINLPPDNASGAGESRLFVMFLLSPSTAAAVSQNILRDSVFFQPDPIIGPRVDAMMKKGPQFKTEEGLDFYRANTVNNEVYKNIRKRLTRI